MKTFEEKLNKASQMCEGMYTDENFARVYSFATENVSGYLKHFDLENKSLLTVGSSGDQIINAYYHSARDITLIDINEFSRFYIFLKISAILALSYNEFKSFLFVHTNVFNCNKELLSKELFEKIKPTIKLFDYESYLFFDELYKKYPPHLIKNLIEFDEPRDKVICGFNDYLKNEQSYNELKKKLYYIGFYFINEDLFTANLDRKYDNIILSNISCYYDLDSFKGLLKRLKDNNLNEEGKMLIAYLWDINYNSKVFNKDWLSIYNLPLVKEKFKEYITEHYAIEASQSMLWWTENKKDLVLVYKKH